MHERVTGAHHLSLFADERAYCEKLASQLNSVQDLPVSCRQYDSVLSKVQESESDPFVGMWPGAAAKARAARSKGQEHHAQFQRRITTRPTQRFAKLDK